MERMGDPFEIWGGWGEFLVRGDRWVGHTLAGEQYVSLAAVGRSSQSGGAGSCGTLSTCMWDGDAGARGAAWGRLMRGWTGVAQGWGDAVRFWEGSYI